MRSTGLLPAPHAVPAIESACWRPAVLFERAASPTAYSVWFVPKPYKAIACIRCPRRIGRSTGTPAKGCVPEIRAGLSFFDFANLSPRSHSWCGSGSGVAWSSSTPIDSMPCIDGEDVRTAGKRQETFYCFDKTSSIAVGIHHLVI
jgi:hypothetical protein